ncbi:restriction endonuclease subunit S [Vibrio cholerae]
MSQLPKGWVETKWKDIAGVDGFRRGPFGGNLKKSCFVQEGFAVYEQYAPINDDCSSFRYFITEEKFEELSGFQVNVGDFLISCSGTMGRITRVPEGAPQGVINQALLRIRLQPEFIDPNYFLKLFKSPVVQGHVLNKSVGGAIQNLAAVKELKEIPLPLAPLAEQTRIVEKLDEVLAQVDTIKARLDGIPAILKRFRQSVLAAAVSGKLTEEWRGQSELSWAYSSLSNCFECIDGDRGPNYPKKEEYLEDGFCLFLSTKNVRKYGFEFKDLVFISKEKDEVLRKGRLERGDLVITTRGTLGHVGSYDEDVPYDVVRINSGMLILRKKRKDLVNDFYAKLISSPLFQKEIETKRTGSAQPQLPAKILKEFLIPVPPIEEQKEIVRLVDQFFVFADTIEAQVKKAQARVDKLTQSILAKAFRGELVPQDPNDEPADKLLERIAAARKEAEVLAKVAKKAAQK